MENPFSIILDFNKIDKNIEIANLNIPLYTQPLGTTNSKVIVFMTNFNYSRTGLFTKALYSDLVNIEKHYLYFKTIYYLTSEQLENYLTLITLFPNTEFVKYLENLEESNNLCKIKNLDEYT